MIGFQILACEQEDGSFICDKVSCWFSLSALQLKDKSPEKFKKEALRLYNLQDGNGKTEFKLTKKTLDKISKASTSIPRLS